VFDVAMSDHVEHITFDVGDVRPEGAPIRGFGGTASGPGPLMRMLSAVARGINRLKDGRLRPLDAMQIDHEIAACVIAGNVRRSARMSILHWKDPFLMEFIHCKDSPEHHWSTNISVEVDQEFWDLCADRNERGHDDAINVLNVIADRMLVHGEPGIYNSSLASVGERGDVRSTNPCGEIALEDGEPCNLGHVNLAYWGDDIDGARNAARLMTRFLIRATFSQVSNEKSRRVLDTNRRIGLGLFGVQEWAAAHGVRWSEIPQSPNLEAAIEMLAWTVELESLAYSKMLGISVPVKTRTIAPTGSIAKLPGVSEGIHPIYAKHFIQRIRYASSDPSIPEGYETEPCLYSENTTVVSIPTKHAILDRHEHHLIESVDELTAESQLKVQRWFQQRWADNAVSFTVNIPEGLSRSELVDALLLHGPYLKGTTVFPDASRPQAPFERVDSGVSWGWEVGDGMADDCATGACPIR